MDASITDATANCVLLAVETSTLVGSAMIKSVITPWTGIFWASRLCGSFGALVSLVHVEIVVTACQGTFSITLSFLLE